MISATGPTGNLMFPVHCLSV